VEVVGSRATYTPVPSVDTRLHDLRQSPEEYRYANKKIKNELDQ
jgi:hypothetical protein